MKENIRNLLEKYFSGGSTSGEEKILRQYFTQDDFDIPEDLKIYAGLFRFIEDEATALAVLNEIEREDKLPVRRSPSLLRKLSAYAAVAAVILIAIVVLIRHERQSPHQNVNIVWVDGHQITDPLTINKFAEISFEKVTAENDIIEEQLRFMLE